MVGKFEPKLIEVRLTYNSCPCTINGKDCDRPEGMPPLLEHALMNESIQEIENIFDSETYTNANYNLSNTTLFHGANASWLEVACS